MRHGLPFSFLLVAMFFVTAPAFPKFGVVKTRVRFAVYHPPAFHAYQQQVRLEVDPAGTRNGPTVGPRIQQLLEEGLSRQGFRLTPSARTLLQVTLTDSTAGLTPTVRSESVNVHVGEHTETDKDGNTKQVEDCRVKPSIVTYLISSGHVALDVKARDTQTQNVLMSQLVERSYRHESAIAGPRKCNGAAYPLPIDQLHDPAPILSMLGDQAVNEALTLVSGYDEPREVFLAVDDVLKPGNAQAVAGAWRDALDTWTNVSPRGKAPQAARHYNLGVAHEVLGALSMRNWELNDASSHLFEAQESYSQALKLDPQEKYFRATMARLQVEQQLLQQQLRQASEEDPAAAAMTARSTTSAPASPTVPLEGWPSRESGAAHDYRVYARTRLGAEKGEPTQALKQDLLSSARDYGIDSETARQVLDSEVERVGVLRQNMETYRGDFQAAASDGVITSEERQMLRRRQQILHLSDEQVREIESHFKVEERG